jgi:hypothetical protein
MPILVRWSRTALDVLGERHVLDVEAGQLEAVLGDGRRDAVGDDLGEVDGVRGHVEHGDAGGRDDLGEVRDDVVADLELDLVGGELAVGADDLGHEGRGVGLTRMV